ncbi:MAG: hypothetical protein OXR62_06315 [Ahrensia sp.]|nr:hypothetical protein [Ahrensia sp.]
MRLILVSFFLCGSAIGVGHAVHEDTELQPVTDSIVVGQTISEEQRASWESGRKAYLDCADCFRQQPFPGDG